MLGLRNKKETRDGDRRPAFRPGLESLEGRILQATRALSGLTSNALVRQDDAPSQQTNIGFSINFFGAVTSDVFVNNNGNITIGQALSQFTPSSLNSDNGGIPIIAPFFADVDTRPVASGVTTFGIDTLCGHQVFGVDWFNVGYFSQHVDKLNTFQLILIDRSDTGAGNFDIEFNYDTILWETGDASGGTNGLGGESARVGYSNGSGIPGTFFELPGSGVNGAFLDGGPRALNQARLLSSTPGRLHFLVRNGEVFQNIESNLDITGASKVFFPYRYIYDVTADNYRGNVTLLNVGGRVSSGADDLCLDIVADDTVLTGSFAGPITTVFTRLPTGVAVLNPTGFTASGAPFITTSIDTFVRRRPLRVPLLLSNPALEHLGTFEQGLRTRVFAGVFDPTVL